jgi:hypothetical protein
MASNTTKPGPAAATPRKRTAHTTSQTIISRRSSVRSPSDPAKSPSTRGRTRTTNNAPTATPDPVVA